MRAILAFLVVTVLWLAPHWVAQPARPEEDAPTQVQRAFGLTPR